jgi:hypothetical protein
MLPAIQNPIEMKWSSWKRLRALLYDFDAKYYAFANHVLIFFHRYVVEQIHGITK